MKITLRIACVVGALVLMLNACAFAEHMELYNLANELCQIDIEGYESTARYYEDANIFTYSMQNEVILPIVWEYMDNKTIQEHYLAYTRMVIMLEDKVHESDDGITVVSAFQLADGTAVYLTVNGIDCSRMVYH